MSKFAYRTIGNEHPQGKPKVYFACHPEDLAGFLENYALKILRIQTCAIWYETEYDADYDREELGAQLSEMQLIVMPVTTKLLTKPNRAMDVEFTIAQEKHIPVLPIMMEGWMGEAFTKRFGNLQYIDPNDKEPSRRSFDEIFEEHIKAVLVGDEMAKRVRAAFDAYIFLSYRKKDRAKAQKLMRLIHKSPLCQDIAIWYDEFLTPGEDFNALISTMLEKSDLFALAVTPNLVNEINYVMATEYPAARRSGKPILPVEMEETDRDKLEESYKGIPDCVDSEDEEALLSALQKILHPIAVLGNDTDPEHCFLIGLAYLDGIDVEVDFERAVRLIRFAAEAGMPEAMKQLATMYETGKGVARDYHEGVVWRRKYVEYFRVRYEEKLGECTFNEYISETLDLKDIYYVMSILQEYFIALEGLGGALYNMHLLKEAKVVYQKMLDISLKESADDNWNLREWPPYGYTYLGDIALEEGRLEEARGYYKKSLDLRLALAEEYHRAVMKRQAEKLPPMLWEDEEMVLFRELISSNLFDLGDVAKAQGMLEEAKAHHEKSFRIRLALAEETGTVEALRDLSLSYRRLGDIASAQGRPEETKGFYEKCLEIRSKLAKETGTLQTFKGLQIICFDFGTFLLDSGTDIGKAKELFQKVVQIEEEGEFPELIKLADKARNVLSMRF